MRTVTPPRAIAVGKANGAAAAIGATDGQSSPWEAVTAEKANDAATVKERDEQAPSFISVCLSPTSSRNVCAEASRTCSHYRLHPPLLGALRAKP